MADAFEVLTQDHQKVKRMLTYLEADAAQASGAGEERLASARSSPNS